MKIAIAAVLLVAGTNTWAAPCAGFADVEDTSPFCASVEWMKNRGVTSGCGPNAYCPAGLVTRLQMAAFMKRMADAMTVPVWVDANGKPIGPRSNASIDDAYWRSSFGVVILGIACGGDGVPGAGFCLVAPPWGDHVYYTTGNCTGQAYVVDRYNAMSRLRFYYRDTEWHPLRVEMGAPAGPIPGVIYNNGHANVTVWRPTGNDPQPNGCHLDTVPETARFVPATDLGPVDFSGLIANPVHLE